MEKWSCGIIENLDVDGMTQTYATDKKTFRHEVLFGKAQDERNSLVQMRESRGGRKEKQTLRDGFEV